MTGYRVFRQHGAESTDYGVARLSPTDFSESEGDAREWYNMIKEIEKDINSIFTF